MDKIPFHQAVPVIVEEPKPIDQIIEEEYQFRLAYLEDLKRAAAEAKISNRKQFDETYDFLCKKFLELLPSGKFMRIELARKSSCPVNYSCIEHTDLKPYQMYAVKQFVYELKQKNYDASHREIVDYRHNTDKDDYYDYCDCYYVVEVKL